MIPSTSPAGPGLPVQRPQLDVSTHQIFAEHYIQMALQELMRGRTTITIAHRLSTVQKADRILVMSKGRITKEFGRAEATQQALVEASAIGYERTFKNNG